MRNFRTLSLAAITIGFAAFGGEPTSLDEALALCRRTYDYVAKSIPEKEARRFAREMKVDEKWAASARRPAP